MNRFIIAFRRSAHSRSRRLRRRGVAMLLVIIAVATATVLSGSYLMSRRTAPALGANAETSSNAKWAAKSGANLALAILQTSLAVKGDLEDDQVVSGVSFGLGGADAVVTNDSGAPAASNDYRLIVSSIGSTESIGSLDQRVLLRRPTNKVSEALDPYLREFAVFATTRLRIEGGASVAPWPDSDRGPSLFAANIGVAFTPSSMASVSGAGSLQGAVLVVGQTATTSLRNLANSATFAGGIEADVQFPTASARVPQALTDLGTSGPPLYVWNPGTTSTAGGSTYGAALVTAGATLVLRESVSSTYSFDDLTVDFGGVLRVEGKIRVLVRDDFNITDRSSFELADENSSVEVYIRDDLNVNNSTVGLSKTLAANTSRSYANISGAFDASAIRFFLIDQHGGGDPNQTVTLDARAMVVADIHAPSAAVDVNSNSMILGRVTGADVRLRGTSMVLYDHTLNPGAGFTNPFGPLYDDDRHDELRQALTTFNNTAGLDTLVKHVTDSFAAAGVNPDPAEAGPISATQPDPRDSAKVVLIPMRRGAARAIEAGVASDGSLSGALVIDSASDLGQVLGGAASVLRSGTPEVLKDLKSVIALGKD